MATELPVGELSSDLRSPAVEQQRSKERRVKYRNVNVDLIGQPIVISVLGQSVSNTTPGAEITWTDKNKYKMNRWHLGRGDSGPENSKRRRVFRKTYIDDEICTARNYPPTATQSECLWDDSSSDNDSIDGVTYSFDHRTGPTAGIDTFSYAVTEAVKKFENKELATLVKNEYEVVDSNEEDEEFELI